MTAQQYFEKLRAECGNDSAKMDQSAQCLDMLCMEQPHLASTYAETAFLLRTAAGTLRCDFCNVQRVPVQAMSCKTHVSVIDGEPLGRSIDNWCACQECADLIEADNADALAERSAVSFFAGHPELADADTRALLLSTLRQTQAGFFAHQSEELAV